ncbi:AAA family ATPase [archaeon]|nr:AAA family ATPase [archaeon]
MDAQTVDEENKILKATVEDLQNELKKYQRIPYLVTQIVDVHKKDEVVIQLNSGKFYVSVAKELEGTLQADDEVLVEQKTLTVVQKIGKSKHFDVSGYIIVENPTTQWNNIGGLEKQIQEVKEVIELPLLKPDLFKNVGIEPPKGVLLYGPPGTGKTLIAKAAAKNSNATFIEIVGSELVQKFIGEGSKFVKSMFELAREKAPSIIFIDEIDSIAAKRIEVGTSGEREVQRTFMQLLAELDGFKALGNIKIIAATNRLDILDPAITRPGRLDRTIEVTLPDRKGILEIFKIHTKKMTLTKDVSLDELSGMVKNVSGAEIRSICTEAGYFAIRKERKYVTMDDFKKAIKKVRKGYKEKSTDYLKLYGQ